MSCLNGRSKEWDIVHVYDVEWILPHDLVLHHCNEMLGLFFCLSEMLQSCVGSSTMSEPQLLGDLSNFFLPYLNCIALEQLDAS